MFNVRNVKKYIFFSKCSDRVLLFVCDSYLIPAFFFIFLTFEANSAILSEMA